MAIQQKNRNEILEAVANRKPFKIASMSGGGNDPRRAVAPGMLPADIAAEMNRARPVYVIWSYSTPIAWVGEDGTAACPKWQYSTTTSQHRGIARVALDI